MTSVVEQRAEAELRENQLLRLLRCFTFLEGRHVFQAMQRFQTPLDLALADSDALDFVFEKWAPKVQLILGGVVKVPEP